MSLNNYRDKAEDFLKKIGAENEGTDIKVNMLEDEITYQIYDMLFILFDI